MSRFSTTSCGPLSRSPARATCSIAALLDTLAVGEPLPRGRGNTGADFVDVLRAYQARSAQIRAATCASTQQGTWGGLLAYLAEHEDALTPEFARDLAEVHSLVNTPAASVDPWQPD